ncbi:hypothetical protein [Neolewinella persica]|uniref:hypothetical protein n=1 Tax=Neolewinella persica TaxID=70998 RepID=UPI0003686FB4|nr:hypothetical protein [Neolewinella persica]
MKIPLLIFVGSVLALFASDFFLTVLPRIEQQKLGEEHPEVKAFIASIDNVVDATGGPVLEKRFAVGLLNRVTVNPGFRVIHNPEMGREVIASGPQAALEQLEISHKTGRIVPDFKRPVRLTKLVEIRLNLHAHGSREMRISLARVPVESTILQPDFVTQGALNFQMLRIANFPDHPLQIASRDLMVYSLDDLSNLHGSVDRLEIMYDEPGDARNLATAPNLKFRKLLRTKMGRD